MQTRRDFIAAATMTATAASAALSAPAALGQARPRLVVVGGGCGGATVARYVARDSGGGVEVVLIEPSRAYHTCFFGNLYLGGFRDYDSLVHGYGRLAAGGVTVVHDMATGVDRDARRVRLASGVDVAYDRLALAPGIDFRWDSVPGYDVAATGRMPHAWKGGAQYRLLDAQLSAMPEGGLFVMTAPPDPYRCPPGPYERASMVAHRLSRANPRAKILILDAKERFSKEALFTEGWLRRYPGMIEWLPASMTDGVTEIDPATKTIRTGLDDFRADVANIIPAQKAGRIAEAAGLTDASGFCPIVPATMQSRMDDAIHVLGDAAIAGDMPKSGFSANSQAKAAAMAIRAALTGSAAFPPRFFNTCWSLIGENDGVKVGARYTATAETIARTEGFISQPGEDAATRRRTYEESLGWYAGMTADMFG
jgi:NADPH-dependent 2,4-dienoyl-CoA reductase/sulfur reductase-like enzyme